MTVPGQETKSTNCETLGLWDAASQNPLVADRPASSDAECPRREFAALVKRCDALYPARRLQRGDPERGACRHRSFLTEELAWRGQAGCRHLDRDRAFQPIRQGQPRRQANAGGEWRASRGGLKRALGGAFASADYMLSEFRSPRH
jgi:hypothetical protein